MKCSNCMEEIDPKFKFAIKKNLCPICGEQIMDAEKLVAFANLKTLIDSNFDGVPVEELATLIVNNFEIKQVFGNQKETKVKKEGGSIEVEENAEGAKSDKDLDEEHKKKQMKEAKAAIRQQEYENALREQYGMSALYEEGVESGDDTNILDTDFDIGDLNPVLRNHLITTEQKQKASYNKMLSGSGAVKRSG